jgi:hypothetical protein
VQGGNRIDRDAEVFTGRVGKSSDDAGIEQRGQYLFSGSNPGKQAVFCIAAGQLTIP